MATVIEKTDAFLAQSRPMLIGGNWVQAQSGETIAVENPATGQEIGRVPAGGEADINLAVTAARKSFDDRVWRGLTADSRAAIMWKLADLIDANIEEFARLEILDNGMTKNFAMATIGSATSKLRYYAGYATKIYGRTAQMGADMEFHGSLSEGGNIRSLRQ